MDNPSIINLQPWTDYVRSRPLLFPTAHSARQFLITRRERMEELGILHVSTRGWLVDGAMLDRHLLKLLATTDGRDHQQK